MRPEDITAIRTLEALPLWADPDRLLAACAESDRLHAALLEHLAARLNALHDTSYSVRQWNILLGYWLRIYVAVMLDRHERFRAAGPDVVLTGGREGLEAPLAFDANGYIHRSFADDHDLFLYSALVVLDQGGELAAAFPSTVPGNADRDSLAQAACNLVSGWKLRSLKRAGLVLMGNSFRAVAGALRRDGSIRARLLDAGLAPRLGPRPCDRDARQVLRGGASGPGPAKDALDLALRLLPYQVPSAYVEFFPVLRGIIRSLDGGMRCRAVVTDNNIHSNPLAQAVACAGIHSGARLACMQHGGGYGMDAYLGTEVQERDTADLFYCWGWAGLVQDQRLHDMPSIKLSKGLRGRHVDSGRIKLVTNDYPRKYFRFHTTPSGAEFQKAILDTLDFLRALEPAVQDKLSIRPANKEYSWNPSAVLAEAGLAVDIEDRAVVGFKESIHNARIVVCDHVMTSFLECMAYGIPVAAFYDPRLHTFAGHARPLVDRLRKVGILHDSPLAAAEFVNKRYHDIGVWWLDREVQSVREEFTARFALASSDWLARWSGEMRRLAHEREP